MAPMKLVAKFLYGFPPVLDSILVTINVQFAVWRVFLLFIEVLIDLIPI